MITTLETKDYSRISDLAESVNLNETVDFKCTFLVERNEEGVILGLAGTRFDFAVPRFEHILIRKEHQKTSLGYRLMLKTEELVRNSGFDAYVALIPKLNNKMRKYAIKFGFQRYNEDINSTWFYKQV